MSPRNAGRLVWICLVDRSGLGGWVLKGICSFCLITPISTFQVIFLVDYISEMFCCFKNIENKISSPYFIYLMVVFCYLVIQRIFTFMKKSYLLLFHFILLPGWFFCLPEYLVECYQVVLAPLWNLKSSNSCFEMLLMQRNCRNTNKHK